MPSYTDNGMKHTFIFTTLFVGGAYMGHYPQSILFDEHMAMLGILNIGAMLFCLYLYVKGWTHPSTADVTFGGRGFLYDYWSGVELYPRVFGIDVKKIVNCRFSMTFWMVYGISATAASYEKHGQLDYGLMACSALTYLYLVKFFWWEIGYMRSIDIIEDNCGFMETWGCLVFVPALYTNAMTCAVNTPSNLSPETAATLFVVGVLCVIFNYWTDRQRQIFRETGGQDMLWWPTKPESLKVNYEVTLPNGKKQAKTSILLVNGFWGMVRHPQYIFELGIACSWGLLTNPTLRYGQSMLYFVFLTILLSHRALRDARKCSQKYGKGYEEYCARVPYLMVPYIY